jgi:hypothetical protein
MELRLPPKGAVPETLRSLLLLPLPRQLPHSSTLETNHFRQVKAGL